MFEVIQNLCIRKVQDPWVDLHLLVGVIQTTRTPHPHHTLFMMVTQVFSRLLLKSRVRILAQHDTDSTHLCREELQTGLVLTDGEFEVLG
jgi:hypothetical protein